MSSHRAARAFNGEGRANNSLQAVKFASAGAGHVLRIMPASPEAANALWIDATSKMNGAANDAAARPDIVRYRNRREPQTRRARAKGKELADDPNGRMTA
jgi:hypothetical protein